jgi:hypothetical protein
MRLVEVVLASGFLEDSTDGHDPRHRSRHIVSHFATSFSLNLSPAPTSVSSLDTKPTCAGHNWHPLVAGLDTRPDPRWSKSRSGSWTSYNLQPNQRAQGKLEFLKFMWGFLPLFPNVIKLHLVGFKTVVQRHAMIPTCIHSPYLFTSHHCTIYMNAINMPCIHV